MRSIKRTAQNSIYSFTNQLITLVLALIFRKLTIQCIGIEVLGISSAFASILETLSLAELGFNTAITYFLYRPLHEKQYNDVSSIIAVFRFVYTCVAAFVGVSALLFTPFLGIFLNGTVINSDVYVLYILMVADTMASYLLSYKRILLYADQKDYYSQKIDLIFNLLIGCLKVIVLVVFRRYDLFLLSKIFQTVMSNIFIYKKCKKIYPEISRTKVEPILLKTIFGNVKHIFGSKLAYYINTSTDNLVISSIIGTITVGMFTNYTTITIGIKRLVVSLMKSVSPLLGDMLADDTVNHKKLEQTLRLYTHITYLICVIILIPTAVLLNEFIQFIYGEKFLLSSNICRLLTLDLYITFIHRGCCDYINGKGLFKRDKYIEYISALINIVISICLAFKLGVIGVMIGTIISGLFSWVGRSYIVYKFGLNTRNGGMFRFWIDNIKYFFAFALMYITCDYLVNVLPKGASFIMWFTIAGIFCELFSIAIYLLFFHKSECYISVKKILIHMIKK